MRGEPFFEFGTVDPEQFAESVRRRRNVPGAPLVEGLLGDPKFVANLLRRQPTMGVAGSCGFGSALDGHGGFSFDLAVYLCPVTGPSKISFCCSWEIAGPTT